MLSQVSYYLSALTTCKYLIQLNWITKYRTTKGLAALQRSSGVSFHLNLL